MASKKSRILEWLKEMTGEVQSIEPIEPIEPNNTDSDQELDSDIEFLTWLKNIMGKQKPSDTKTLDEMLSNRIVIKKMKDFLNDK